MNVLASDGGKLERVYSRRQTAGAMMVEIHSIKTQQLFSHLK